MFESLEDEADKEVEDLEADSNMNKDEDEIDSSVEASDQGMIDTVTTEADRAELSPLTQAEVNLGCFTITKVWSSWWSFSVITH